MSISVVQNPDGTFTVTCGDTSVIVGGKPSVAGPWTDPGHGVSANVSRGAAEIQPWTPTGGGIIFAIRDKDQDDGRPVVGNVDGIENILKMLPAPAAYGLNEMKFGWAGTDPLDIDALRQKVRDAVGEMPLGIVIQAIDGEE